MIADLGFRIETSSVQKAAALRDKISDYLNADEDTTVIDRTARKVTRDYRVRGVDVTTSEVFTEQVEAVDAADAEGKVATATKVVVIVDEAAA